MKTGSSKMKNLIGNHGNDGSHAAELLKEAWRAFRSLLKASPNLIKMDVEKLKDNHVIDHLLRTKKRRSYNDDAINILTQHSTSTVFTFDHLSHPVHDAASGHNNLSLVIERTCDGGSASGSSGGCSASTIVSIEEVDELADAFISRFYNNVRLEKQRSYRMYQEMLARGT